MANGPTYRIGMVSTRLAGTDGVSLESAKWAGVLSELGHRCFYFAGECDRPPEASHVLPEAHFIQPTIRRINGGLFGVRRRSPETSQRVRELTVLIKDTLRRFIEDRAINLLIVENALSLPMNVPLGLAITELVAEADIPTIAHHHDFAWERPRYTINAAADYLRAAFPPAMADIHHVVINSHAAREMARRTGMRNTLIPNVMDFEHPPEEPDEYCDDLRQSLDIPDSDYLLLQPTRVVPRKRIERSIELARQIDLPCTLLITHGSGDEGEAYRRYLVDYAEVMGVKVLFAAGRFDQVRGRTDDGQKVYALRDAYHHADLVTYPSHLEGFGNAFLEAIYYRRPLFMGRYDIFNMDIEPKGFQIIGFDEFIDEQTIAAARSALTDPARWRETTDHNYELGKRHYSYRVLRRHLKSLIAQMPHAEQREPP